MYFDFPNSREFNKKADASRDSLLLSCPNFPGIDHPFDHISCAIVVLLQ